MWPYEAVKRLRFGRPRRTSAMVACALVACPARMMASTYPGAARNAPRQLSQPAPFSLTVDGAHENIIVHGRRPLVLAPLPGPAMIKPPTGFVPGGKLGPFDVIGGPTDGFGSKGVSAGLSLPIKGVKGLSFDINLGASRDPVSHIGSAAGAQATVGFKLKF